MGKPDCDTTRAPAAVDLIAGGLVAGAGLYLVAASSYDERQALVAPIALLTTGGAVWAGTGIFGFRKADACETALESWSSWKPPALDIESPSTGSAGAAVPVRRGPDRKTAELWATSGASLLSDGKLDEADAAFGRCADADASFAACVYGSSRVKRARADLAGAREACRRFLALASDAEASAVSDCAAFLASSGADAPVDANNSVGTAASVRKPLTKDQPTPVSGCTDAQRAEMEAAGMSKSAITEACR